MKKIKPYLSLIVGALIIIGIALFGFLYPRSDNDPLYRAFEENRIVYEINNPNVGNTQDGKEAFLNVAPSLKADDVPFLRWGFFDCEEEDFSGMFFRFRAKKREMYDAAKQSKAKVALAGNYILVFDCDGELPQKLQNVFSRLGGITEKNF